MNSAGLIGDGYLPSRAAPEKSDRQLAKAIGVSPTTVGTARKDLEVKGEVSKLDTSTGADGKERPRNSTKFYQVFCTLPRARARVERLTGGFRQLIPTPSRPRPRGAPFWRWRVRNCALVAPVRVWSALMFGFVRFSAVATAPGFVLFAYWGNWRAVEFATGFATPVSRTTGCAMRCAMVGCPRSAVRT